MNISDFEGGHENPMQNQALAGGDDSSRNLYQMKKLKSQVGGHIDKLMSLKSNVTLDIEEAVKQV